MVEDRQRWYIALYSLFLGPGRGGGRGGGAGGRGGGGGGGVGGGRGPIINFFCPPPPSLVPGPSPGEPPLKTGAEKGSRHQNAYTQDSGTNTRGTVCKSYISTRWISGIHFLTTARLQIRHLRQSLHSTSSSPKDCLAQP